MITHALDITASAAFWMAIRASALLAGAALAQVAWGRGRSAAARHLVWTLAIAGILLLPAATLVVPGWSVTVHRPSALAAAAPGRAAPVGGGRRAGTSGAEAPDGHAAATQEALAATAPPAPRASEMSWRPLLGAVYGAGALLLLAQLVLERRRVREFSRAAVPVVGDAWAGVLGDGLRRLAIRRRVRLLRSGVHSVPLACGTLRPAIVVPLVADTWADDRRRAVVLHELAHVARQDCLTQTLASIACALYWFHPAVWWVAWRLRVEREHACDDRVILAGTEGRAYAGHLLEIASSLGRQPAPALAIAMARPHQLEGRMVAALDATRERRPPTRGARAACVGAAVLVLGTVAGARSLAIVETAGLVAGVTEPESTAPPVQSRSSAWLELPVFDDLRRLAGEVADSLGLQGVEGAGTWELKDTGTPTVIHLRLKEGDSSSGQDVPIARLEGLTSAQLAGDGAGVRFRLRREAGTFTFEGTARRGLAAGTFAFAPDLAFAGELERRGYARPTAHEQYELAKHDVGFAFLDELAAQGYAKARTPELVKAAQHGVDTRYLHEMGGLGYRLGSLDPLVRLRDHGVTPDYVRGLRDLGYKALTADELRTARDHGITPEYMRGMREAGTGVLPIAQLIEVRDHGVTPEYVRALGEAGHPNVPIDQLVRVRDHGVTPEYVHDMRQLGYAPPLDDLVEARDHGVTADFAREMAAQGYGGLPVDVLVRLRDHGITPQYARDLKALGYDGLAPDDLVTLRDHGVTPDRIRAANARAGSRLPIDQLRSLADRGQI